MVSEEILRKSALKKTNGGKFRRRGRVALGMIVGAAGAIGALQIGAHVMKKITAPTANLSQKPVFFPKPSSNMSVVLREGDLFLSAKFIDAELERRGSPAAGNGWAFEKWGRHYGIRPEIGLCFFRKESTWGKYGRATENKSIGNWRYPSKSNGGAKYTNNNGLRKYPSWEEGIKDFFRLLSGSNYVIGGNATLKQIIPKYAPRKDGNRPKQYIADITKYLVELYAEASIAQ